MSRTVRIAIGVLSWALLTIGCGTTLNGTQASASQNSASESSVIDKQFAIEREKEATLAEKLKAYDKAFETISGLCNILGSDLALVASNSTPPDSSYDNKHYLVQLNVGTRSLEEEGLNGFTLNLASNNLAMASQQIVEAEKTKEQLDRYFDSFDYSATVQEIQNEYEFNQPYYDKLYSEHEPMRNAPRLNAEMKTANLNNEHSYVERDRKLLPDFIGRYTSILATLSARLAPFLDQANTESSRRADRKSLYKEHIEKVVASDATLVGRSFSGDSGMVIVEPVTRANGVLSVILRLVVYPFSQASISNVHVYDDSGQHLGLPIAERLAVYDGRKWVDCQQYSTGFKQGDAGTGVEYIISRSFHAENMPSQGKLKILITGKNIRVDCATDYRTDTNEYKLGSPVNLVSQPQSVVSSTRTIKCRRDGNHLWVPVEIGSGNSMQNIELLLDTGASITCIPSDIYDKLGLKNVNHEEIQLETANGQISADTVILPVKTSAFQRDIRVAFNSSNRLLGVNYFADCIFTVDVINECIYVKRNGVQLDEYQTLTDGKKQETPSAQPTRQE